MTSSPTALDLPMVSPLPEATQKYFDICQDKLGMVPNVLQAYAFDIDKLNAFTTLYNDVMLNIILLNLQTIYDVCIYTSRAKEELRDGGVDVTLGCADGLFLWVFCSERRLSKGAEELFTVNS